MQVSVVNSYAATLLSVPVSLVSRVDFPTEGNPIIPTLASPLLDTSNPSPAGPVLPLLPSINSRLNLANFAFNWPM